MRVRPSTAPSAWDMGLKRSLLQRAGDTASHLKRRHEDDSHGKHSHGSARGPIRASARQRLIGQVLAALGPGVADGVSAHRLAGLDQVPQSRFSRRRLLAYLRPLAAGARQRRHLRRVLAALSRAGLLHRAASVRPALGRREIGVASVIRLGPLSGDGIHIVADGIQLGIRGRRVRAAHRRAALGRAAARRRPGARHHLPAQELRAVRGLVVHHRGVHLDLAQSRAGQSAPAVFADVRREQRGPARLVHPLRRGPVDHAGGDRGHEVLHTGGEQGYAVNPFVVFDLSGCFQGSAEALRRMQELTHFIDVVIAHSHATIFGTFVVAMMGAMYYVWPRVTGNQLWSWRLASWHLWLTIIGFCVMVVGLTAQGFIEGGMFENKVNFGDEVVAMKPWWVVRTFAGASMDIGILLMVINFYKTARQRVPFREAPTRALEAHPAGAETKGVYKWIVNPSALTLGAGVSFFAFGVIIQGIWPSIVKESNEPTVADASTGKLVRVASYPPLELRGREVYIREGCWYCQSQYVRPVTKEYDRWGPVSDASEYVFVLPHMFGTRRTGPDLLRVGRKYADGWHAAHHWNPRIIVPDSIMPRFPWLFDQPVNGEAPQLNEEGKALVAYIQRLGTTLGDWRETYSPTRLDGGAALLVSGRQNNKELVALGKQVYLRRCVGCHGEQGDGKGPGAQYFKVTPRDFTSGIIKFRSTSGGINTLPSDEDLFITVTHGRWGTPMPPWYDIPSEERMAVIQYIKTFSDRWKKEPVNPPIKIPTEPQITEAALAHGKQLFAENCAVCHGIKGRGQGPAADHIHDVWGRPLRPANFTLPAGVGGGVKLGHDALHIYKTIMTGVGGTPMPPFALSKLTPEEVWDIVHYVQSLRIDAHMRELIAAGLRDADRSAARTQLWVNLSDAAARGRIEQQVVQVDGTGSTPLVLGQVR